MSLVTFISRASWNPTAASTVKFSVNFLDAVTGVDATDFVVTAPGITGAVVTDVSGSGKNYIVTVTTGTGEGTLRLDVVDDDSIMYPTPFGYVSIGGPGPGNGNYSFGDAYTIDRDVDNTPPELLSFVRAGSNPTNATSVDYTLTFSENVGSVDASDFQLGHSGFSSAPFISNVSGLGTTWTVTINTGSGDGQLGLGLKGRVGTAFIHDAAEIPLNTSTSGWYTTQVLVSLFPTVYEFYGNFNAQPYQIDKTAPMVSSVVRAGTDPTNALTVDYTVKFSEGVTGVDASDFALTAAGVSGAGIVGVSGSGDTWTVTVSTGTGEGTIRLDVLDDDTIGDGATNPLGGGFTGQTYTMDHTAPTLTITSDKPTLATGETATITFTFDEDPGTTFTSGDIVVSGGTLGALSGSGLTRTAVFTAGSMHSASITVAAGEYTDEAGNAGAAGATPSISINGAPVANADDAPVTEGTSPNLISGNVLANDSDLNSDTLSVSNAGVHVLAYGTLTLLASGDYDYVLDDTNTAVNALNAGQSLTDSFVYDVDDGHGGTASAQLNVRINGVNDAPSAGNVTLPSIAVNSGAQQITQAQLLANTTDPDSASLVVTNLQIASGFGTLLPTGEGVLTYTPKTNDDTEVNFTFTVHDGQTSSNGQAKLDITSAQSAPEIGGPGDDTFTAVTGNAAYIGLGGIDTINLGFKLTEATVTYLGNQVIIDGPSSHTVLTGFEKFVFTDGTVDNNDGNWLVDDLFYYSRSHDVWNANIDADLHYSVFGWKEDRDSSAFFDTSLYRALYPDVKAAGVNPLTHFDQSGWKEGRAPSFDFDPAAYLAANPDVKAADVDPLLHFLQFGAQEERQPTAYPEILATNGFDYVYYLQNNADVAAAGIDPYAHFQQFGWKEGRDPNALFDTAGYLANYGDVKNADSNPLDHYHAFGWKEGRDPSVGFDSSSYLAANADVQAAGIDPLAHYLDFGRHEGRSTFADGVWG
jgi:VCBS repeat-containing protein